MSNTAVATRDSEVLKVPFKNLEVQEPAKKKIKSISVSQQYDENYYSYSDQGNADRIYEKYGENIDYISELGKFAIYDGNVHVIDNSGKRIHNMYREMGSQMVREARKIEDVDARETAFRWCRNSEFYKIFDSTLSHLKRMTAQSLLDYDRDDFEINCKNGTLNLKTFELKKSSPENKHLKVINAAYDENADCPKWKKFIQEITSKDGVDRLELAIYLQKILGYTLTGDTSEKCIFFFYGSKGDNGKSTVMHIVNYLLSPYAGKISSGALMKKKFGANEMRNDLAALVGCRFVVGSEMSASDKFDDALIRDLVGGDEINCRFLRQEFFTFEPKFKLFLYGNNKPRIDANDRAIKNKIKMIPFDYVPPVLDYSLKSEFKKESDGIFLWMVEGLKMYQAEGLKDPEIITDLTKKYFDSNDTLGRFISEYLVTGDFNSDKQYFISSPDMYELYCKWAKSENMPEMSQKALGNRLSDKGLENGVASINGKPVRGWKNYKAKTDEEKRKEAEKEIQKEIQGVLI